MLSQFSSQYFKSNLNLLMCDSFALIRTLLLKPILFLALFISTGASAGYDVKVETYLSPEEHADIEFKGHPPLSLGGFDQYTIEKFELKIKGKQYSVSKHDNASLYVSINNLNDLNYSLDQWPSSYLVLTWDLSFFQFLSEIGKCLTKHASWKDIFRMRNKPLSKCTGSAAYAYKFNQTYSIDITASMKQEIDRKIETFHNKIDDLIPDLERYLVFSTPPKKIPKNEETIFVQIQRQSRAVFGLATTDYYMTKGTTFLEALDKLTIVENHINILKEREDLHKLSRIKDILTEEFKAFNSDKCEGELPQQILPNLMHRPRLLTIAKNYAKQVCKFNLLSFDKKNTKNNITIPVAFNHSGEGVENSAYIPYVFCDAYTCQFNISKTLKYRLVDTPHASFMLSDQDTEQLHSYLNSERGWNNIDRLCLDSCIFTINDIYSLKNLLDQLHYEVFSFGYYFSWKLIKIEE